MQLFPITVLIPVAFVGTLAIVWGLYSLFTQK